MDASRERLRAAVESSPSGAVLSRGLGEWVLLVEDERTLAAVGGRQLAALGYSVVVETDPFKALEQVRENPSQFDVLVTDYSMPRMMGLALAQAVLELRPDLPVLMMTGFIEDELAERAAAIGVRRLLRKPVPLLELAEAIQGTLGGPASAPPPHAIQ